MAREDYQLVSNNDDNVPLGFPPHKCCHSRRIGVKLAFAAGFLIALILSLCLSTFLDLYRRPQLSKAIVEGKSKYGRAFL